MRSCFSFPTLLLIVALTACGPATPTLPPARATVAAAVTQIVAAVATDRASQPTASATVPPTTEPTWTPAPHNTPQEVVTNFWEAYLARDGAALLRNWTTRNRPGTNPRLYLVRFDNVCWNNDKAPLETADALLTCLDRVMNMNVESNQPPVNVTLLDAPAAPRVVKTIFDGEPADREFARVWLHFPYQWPGVKATPFDSEPALVFDVIPMRVTADGQLDDWKVRLVANAWEMRPRTPTPAPTLPAGVLPLPTPYAACAGAPLTRLTVGGAGFVSLGGANNRLRDAAGTKGKVIGEMRPGAVFQVLSGPVCANGMAWYEVRPWDTTGAAKGWTAEGALSGYWVEPCPVGGECGQQLIENKP